MRLEKPGEFVSEPSPGVVDIERRGYRDSYSFNLTIFIQVVAQSSEEEKCVEILKLILDTLSAAVSEDSQSILGTLPTEVIENLSMQRQYQLRARR